MFKKEVNLTLAVFFIFVFGSFAQNIRVIDNKGTLQIFNPWRLNGNTATDPNTSFLGTTDNVALRFRTNNLERFTITGTGYVGIGTMNPVSRLSNSSVSVTGSDAKGSSTFTMVNNIAGTWAGSFYTDAVGNGLNIKVKDATASTIALQVGSGNTSEQSSVGAAGSSPLFNVLGNGTVGIRTVTPLATLDINGVPASATAIDGVIAPRLTGDQLFAKGSIYGAAQTGTILYVTAAASPANQTSITTNVSVPGYYYFDGVVWQRLQTASNLSTNMATNAGSTTMYPSVAAVETYVTANATPDASLTTKGKIQLAGDLAGTAALPEVAANAITTTKIADGTIVVADLANDAIETAKIKDLNVSTAKIADAAVTTAKIASGGNNKVLVTDNTGAVAWLNKDDFGGVTDLSTIEGAGTTASPFKVKDLGIVTAKLANDAVTTAKIADANVTNAKLTNDAVSTDKILDGTIITADLANNAIETAKIKDLNVSTSKIADAAITNAKIGETITVSNGGTGATSLTGYIKGNGTNAMSASATIPVADVPGAQTTANLSTNMTTNTGSTSMYPSVAAVETYVAANATPNATTSLIGKIQLAGDLAGTATSPLVVKLQGTSVNSITPTTGQLLQFDGSAWKPVSKSTVINMETEEVAPTAGQTFFTVSNTPIGKVAFFINGVRVPKNAISVSGTTITYNPASNDGYVILGTDRISFDYVH
jgi:hypothetical protein